MRPTLVFLACLLSMGLAEARSIPFAFPQCPKPESITLNGQHGWRILCHAKPERVCKATLLSEQLNLFEGARKQWRVEIGFKPSGPYAVWFGYGKRTGIAVWKGTTLTLGDKSAFELKRRNLADLSRPDCSAAMRLDYRVEDVARLVSAMQQERKLTLRTNKMAEVQFLDVKFEINGLAAVTKTIENHFIQERN